jgi:N-methylhydantoinase B
MGGGPFALCLELRIAKGHLHFDFRGSADQARGGINANRSIVTAASVYVFRCLCPARLPTNEGLFRLLSIHTRPGSILEPSPGSPVAGGNVETSQRLVDLCMQAFAKALPDRIPACSAGTMSNLTLGMTQPHAFASYETLPGGAGAGPSWAGASALQTHMTNTRNTPIEEAELVAPLRVTALTVRRGSGGKGRQRGGDGIIKEIEVAGDATVSLFAERHLGGAPGLAGGLDGKPGKATVISAGRSQRLAPKVTRRLVAGDRIRIETPGGGGWGKA